MHATTNQDRIVKRCGCGRTYIDRTWRELPRIGFQVGVRGDRDVPCELRNCSCGSTISLEVEIDVVIRVACGGVDRERSSAARTAIDLLHGRTDG